MFKSRRRSIYSFCKNVDLADGCYVSPLSRVYDSSLLPNSSIGWFCQIQSCIIGEGVSIGSHCSIGAMNHLSELPVQRFSSRSFGHAIPTTHISHDVWIGSNTTILSGVYIGTGAIIGANSFVNCDVGDYEVFAGSPARLIKKRFPSHIINKLLAIQPWKRNNKELLDLLSKNLSIDEYLAILKQGGKDE